MCVRSGTQVSNRLGQIFYFISIDWQCSWEECLIKNKIAIFYFLVFFWLIRLLIKIPGKYVNCYTNTLNDLDCLFFQHIRVGNLFIILILYNVFSKTWKILYLAQFCQPKIQNLWPYGRGPGVPCMSILLNNLCYLFNYINQNVLYEHYHCLGMVLRFTPLYSIIVSVWQQTYSCI